MAKYTLFLFAALTLPAQVPRELIQKSLESDQKFVDLAQQYTYLETVTERDGKKATAKPKVEVFEVMNLYGQPYRRLIKKQGQPLSPSEERREQQKIDKLVAQRSKETPAQREARLEKNRQERRKEREFLTEIPKAFQFRLAGETVVAGADAWIVEATPAPGYKPKNAEAARFLPKLKGKFYINKADSVLLKLEAVATESISFGFVLARLEKGGAFTLEQVRVNNEIWMPARVKLDISGRLGLVKKVQADVEVVFSNHRKFQTDSRIVATGDLNQ